MSSFSSVRAPKILYIEGVFIEDLIGFPKFKNKAVNTPPAEVNVLPLPAIYNNRTWPKKYNVDCVECFKPIINAPLFIPRVIFRDGENKINMMYTANELFCGMVCSTSHIKKREASYFDQVENLQLVEFLIDDMSS
jgi:hypothetical protein